MFYYFKKRFKRKASDRRNLLKIAFWSSVCNPSSVTSSMAAVSMAWAFSCEPQIAVTENHWNGFGIREMLGVPWSFGHAQKRSYSYFYGETVYNRAIEGLSKEIIFLENKLRYIPIQAEPFFHVLCENIIKPFTVQYYIASCVNWVPRLTLLGLMNKLDLQMCSQNGTHL